MVTDGHTISDSADWITFLLPVRMSTLWYSIQRCTLTQVDRLLRLLTSVKYVSSLRVWYEIGKKSLAEIAIMYGYVYVAQIALGANPAQAVKAIAEAEAYNGPSLIIGYAPCELHGIAKGGMNHCQDEMKKAVAAVTGTCSHSILLRRQKERIHSL